MTSFKKHISFPSIEKFSTVVSNVLRRNNFVGLDENGDAIYDPSKPKPVINFKGSVKLHGTNAGVCYNQIDGIWYQSRENIITQTPQTFYEIEFEDGTKELFNSEDVINGKLITAYEIGDVIVL